MLVDDLVRDVEISSQSSFSLKDSMANDESYDLSHFLSSLNLSTATTSLDSLNSMQSVFELDGNYNVVLQGRIGQVRTTLTKITYTFSLGTLKIILEDI